MVKNITSTEELVRKTEILTMTIPVIITRIDQQRRHNVMLRGGQILSDIFGAANTEHVVGQ